MLQQEIERINLLNNGYINSQTDMRKKVEALAKLQLHHLIIIIISQENKLSLNSRLFLTSFLFDHLRHALF